MLWNHQKEARTLTATAHKLREYPRHCALVVADKNPALPGGQAQHQFVIHAVQSGTGRGLEIDTWLPARRRVDNDSFEIVVSLEPNAHCGFASCSRAFCRRA